MYRYALRPDSARGQVTPERPAPGDAEPASRVPVPRGPFRMDTHCHSTASSVPSHWLMQALRMPECPTPPERVYRVARARGMHGVTITDHDTIDGALTLAHLPGFVVGEEITARFPEDGCPVHVVALGLTPHDHERIQQARHDLYELVALLRQRRIAHYLAHPLAPVGPQLSSWHVERLLLLFHAWAAADAAHTPRLHAATEWLVRWANEGDHLAMLAERHDLPVPPAPSICLTGGSDDHSGLTIGLSYTEADGARTVDEFLEALRQGRVRPGGMKGDDVALPRAVYSVGYQVLKERGMLPGGLGRLGVVLDGWLTPPGSTPATPAARPAGVWTRLSRSGRTGSPGRHAGHPVVSAAVLRAADWWFSRTVALAAKRLARGGVQAVLQDAAILRAALTAHGMMLPLWMTIAQQRKDERAAAHLAAAVMEADPGASHELAPLPTGGSSVGYFVDTLDEINGVSLTSLRLAGWAARTGHDLTVLGADVDRRRLTQQAAARVRPLRTIARMPLPGYPALILHVPSMTQVLQLASSFDVIHAATPGPVGLAALAAARMLGRPFTAAYHTHLPEYAEALTGSPELAQLAWRAMRWFYGEADRILVPSRAVAEHLLAHGIDAETGGQRLVVFRRGVDTEAFHPRHRVPGFWARRGVPEGPAHPVVLYVGRISKEKNLDALLSLAAGLGASASLRALGVFPVVVLVGEGPYREELERRAPPNVRFTGPLTGAQLAAAYASAAVFAFPSVTDTFGNVVLEAMASGLPCLVTDRGGPQEQVVDGQTGWVLPAERWVTEALGCLEMLLARPELLQAMGARARAEAERRPVDAGLEEMWRSIAQAARLPAERARRPAPAEHGAVPAGTARSDRAVAVHGAPAAAGARGRRRVQATGRRRQGCAPLPRRSRARAASGRSRR
ncbi:MAG: glycosyltransferase [Limnochordaceae bacterium]|nr:glycosyltransferase [Limnochordaceae bacterium]